MLPASLTAGLTVRSAGDDRSIRVWMCWVSRADSAGGAETWKVVRAASIEKQLRGAHANLQTVADCLGQVPSVVQPGHCKDAAFTLQAAEGLLFEALAALLQQVS